MYLICRLDFQLEGGLFSICSSTRMDRQSVGGMSIGYDCLSLSDPAFVTQLLDDRPKPALASMEIWLLPESVATIVESTH